MLIRIDITASNRLTQLLLYSSNNLVEYLRCSLLVLRCLRQKSMSKIIRTPPAAAAMMGTGSFSKNNVDNINL